MVPKSIGIGLLFVVSSSALLTQDVSLGGLCCCRKTSGGKDDCLNDQVSAKKKGDFYVPFAANHKDLVDKIGDGWVDRNNKRAGCCKVQRPGCDKVWGFTWHVNTFQPAASEDSGRTCQGLPEEIITQPIPGLDARAREECPPFEQMECPPPGQCKKPHDYMICRGVNMAVCFINEFQKIILNPGTDVFDAASITRNVARVTHQANQGVPWSKWADLKPESLDAGVFGDFMFSTHKINPVLAYADAGAGVFINSLKLIDLICYDKGSDCTRTKHMVSIAVGITSFALALTGVGIPFHFLLNGLTSVLVGKLGPMICKEGVKEIFRRYLFCPSRQLMQDIGESIKHIKAEYFSSWEMAMATFWMTPLLILTEILKLVGKLIINIAWGIAKLVYKLPKTLIASVMAVKDVANGKTKTKEEEERDHFCCALKAVKDTEETMEDTSDHFFVDLKEEALQKEEETGDEPFISRLKMITYGPGQGLDEVEEEQVVEDQLDTARRSVSRTDFDKLMKGLKEQQAKNLALKTYKESKPDEKSEPAYCKVVA